MEGFDKGLTNLDNEWSTVILKQETLSFQNQFKQARNLPIRTWHQRTLDNS
jgi:hypothetical protein